MFRTSRHCPRCEEPIQLRRSRPSPFPRIFGHQLWYCDACGWMFETANVIVREAQSSQSKNWISRIEDFPNREESRRRQRANRTKNASEDSLSNGERNSDHGSKS